MDRLNAAVAALREWQRDGAPAQLHPGDVGWFRRFGEEATSAAVRAWSGNGRILAVGLLDSPGLLRLAIAPDAQQDESLARRVAADLTETQLEAPRGALIRDVLLADGWTTGELWTPLRRDLTEPVPDPGVRVELADAAHVRERVDVQRAAFDRSTFTDERWHAMADGPAYADARCLVGYDAAGHAVAAATVWSAGQGRPGLLEPVGVHREHRGHGYGTAITLAAAAALREFGSSSALVCTRSANVGAVATYRSAGFEQLPETPDLRRSEV